MHNVGARTLKGNDAFEGYAIDLIEAVARVLSKFFEVWCNNNKHKNGSAALMILCLQSFLNFRVQLHLQMGRRYKLWKTESRNRRMEWNDWRASVAGSNCSNWMYTI